MADITMCNNQQCEMRGTCYRVSATPSDWQSWSIFTPKDGDCDYYVEDVFAFGAGFPRKIFICVRAGQ